VDPFVGEIRVFGFEFAPDGWATCDGRLLPIGQNTALFSIIGTIYGGDGRTNFALPNLQGRAPMFWGTGPGLTEHYVGEAGGEGDVTLLGSELPVHQHALRASGARGQLRAPDTTHALASSQLALYKQPRAAKPQPLAPEAVGESGGSQPHNNMMPFLAVNFCIALQGIFPPRY
jgi:microcystin-dependent protein